MTITQWLSSDGKLRKLSVISTLTWLWKVLKIFFVTAFGKLFGEDLSAGHTDNKLAAGRLPAKVVNPAIRLADKNHVGHNPRHPANWRGNIFGKIWALLQVLLKNSLRKSAEKLFASLVCLLRSLSKDLSAGKRYFVEVAVNCVPALWASNRGVGSVRCATNFTKTSSS